MCYLMNTMPESTRTPAPQPGGGRLVESYRELAERNPADRFALHSLLIAYLSQKAYIEGIRQFMKFAAADVGNEQAYMCMGVLYDKGGYGDEAIQSYLRVLALNPDEELVYIFLSTRYLLKGDYQNAVKVCGSGLERFPRLERLHFNLGYACSQLKQYDKAIEAFQKTIEINPQCSEAYFNIDVIKRNKLSQIRLGTLPAPDPGSTAKL